MLLPLDIASWVEMPRIEYRVLVYIYDLSLAIFRVFQDPVLLHDSVWLFVIYNRPIVSVSNRGLRLFCSLKHKQLVLRDGFETTLLY